MYLSLLPEYLAIEITVQTTVCMQSSDTRNDLAARPIGIDYDLLTLT